jgi:hypothetical protein
MAVQTFPAASSGGGAALPLGAVAQVASAYAPYGGTTISGTFTAGTTYLLTIQGDSSKSYGLYAPASNLTMHDIKGGQTVAFKPTSTESSIQVGPHDPFNFTTNSAFVGITSAVGGANGLFIIGTDANNNLGGYIYTSTDSITWTNRTSGIEQASSQIKGQIVYANGNWIICGAYKNSTAQQGYLYSSNGTTWTFAAAAAAVNDVAYGAGLYAFALDSNTQVYTASALGGTLTGRTTNLDSTSVSKSISYGSIRGTNYFVVTGTSTVANNFAYSTDGINWTGISQGGVALYGIAHNGLGQWIAGTTQGSSISQIQTIYLSIPYESGYTTPDASIQAYTGNSYSSLTSIYGVSYIYGLWHLTGANIGTTSAQFNTAMPGLGRVLTSPDGMTWTIRNCPVGTKTTISSKIGFVNGMLIMSSQKTYGSYQTTAHPSAACTIYVHSTAF